MFKDVKATELRERVGPDFCKQIRTGFILAAASNALVFVEERARGTEYVDSLSKAIISARQHNKMVWGDIMDRPNAHTGLHIPESAALYGVPTNVNASRFETKHSTPKSVAADSNNRVLERQMMLDAQVQDAIHFIAHGGEIHPGNTSLSADAVALLQTPDDVVARLLNARVSNDQRRSTDDECKVTKLSRRTMISSKTSYGKHIGARGLTSQELIWSQTLTQVGVSRSGCQAVAGASAGTQYDLYDAVGLPGREFFCAVLNKGEFWEVQLPPGGANMPVGCRLPVGPSIGVAILQILDIVCIDRDAYVRPLWLGRARSVPQQMTQCHSYELRTHDKFPALVKAQWLQRRVHVHQTAGMFTLNRFFIK